MITVAIADAATVTADEAGRHRLGWAGHSTTFTCVARGLPAPGVSWLRHDHFGHDDEILSDEIYTVTTTALGDQATSHLQVSAAFTHSFHYKMSFHSRRLYATFHEAI